jgi:6-phosphofructokinase 1
VLADVDATLREHGQVVMVLCENQPEPGGQVLGSTGEPLYTDAFGHAYFPSPAEALCRRIRADLGTRARWEKYGTLQRMSIAYRSETDAAEATEVGRHAARVALDGLTDRMVILTRDSDAPYRCGLDTAPLDAIANQQRTLPDEMVPEPRGGPTPAFRRYAEPLLGSALPRHARLT